MALVDLVVAKPPVVESGADRARHNAVNWGLVPDYSGTPLYDGNDSTRITCTDNSPALERIIETAPVFNGDLRIYFPSGHYGFKTAEILLTAAMRPEVTRLTLLGAGMDSTVLDFVYERTDVTSAVPETASVLLRILGIPVYTEDLHVKCTTKLGVVHGSTSPDPGNPDVYNGAVWFMHVQDAAIVRNARTRVSHCNFRGISVDAQNLPIYLRTKWTFVECEGHDNTSTGFWGSFVTSMHQSGGRFFHNGTLGLLGTGYGFAASQYVDHVLAHGGEFFENYRKGIDRHGGVGTLTVADTLFADNLLRDIEDNKQYNGQYAVADLNDTIISNSTFLLNRNRAWLKAALDAVQAGGGSLSCFKCFVSILDRTISGTIAGKQSRINLSNCTIKVLGNVPDGYQGFAMFNLEAPTTDVEGCTIDTTGFRFADGTAGNVYQSYWAATGAHDNAVVRFKRCNIKTHPGSITHPGSSELSNSVFITATTGTVIEWHDSEVELINFIPYGVTGGGNVSAANTIIRRGWNSTFLYRNMRLRTQNQTTTNAFTWISSGYGAKGTTGNDFYQNCWVGVGDAKVLAPLCTTFGMGCRQDFQINAASKAVGAVQPVLLGVLSGNVHVSLQGALELNADVHRSGFRYSGWTQTVYTGSSYIAFERIGTEAVQYNGSASNFIATKMQARFAVASPSDTGYYNGEISCNDWSAPLIVG